MQYMTNIKNITEEDAALVMSLSGVAEATCSFIISIIGTITLNKKKTKELNTRKEKLQSFLISFKIFFTSIRGFSRQAILSNTNCNF